MKLHYRGEPFPLEELRKELTEAGAEFLDPTNEWEVLRYRYGGRVGIVYRNSKGKATPAGAAGQHVAAMLAGRPITMSAKAAKRLRPAAALQLHRCLQLPHHRCGLMGRDPGGCGWRGA